jgi:poly-gamma-glutamate capsule biosynthesis protein CapA/YwtB (metallophosphatase superfamily)
MYNGTLATVGETKFVRPFSMKTDPDFLALIKILQEADVTYAHEEMIIHSYEGYMTRPLELHMSCTGEPIMADELRWAGIDIVSTASNHSCEWGEEGVRANNKNLDRARVAHAGTGMNLEEAGAPAYVESDAGRVALIAMSTGHHPYDSAGLTKTPVRGRPGLNPLRITMKYILDHETAEKLKEVWQTLGLRNAMRGDEIRRYIKLGEGDFYFDFEHVHESYIEGYYFGVGDKPSIVSIPNQWDVERNLKMIKEAKMQADLVLVAHHNASSEGERDDFKPSSFIPPFAKACIDAGADVYIGHGWHRELGIEIYKNKPIFYSLGNFISRRGTKQALAADTYEGAGLDLNYLAAYTPMDALLAAGGFARRARDPNAGKVKPSKLGGILPLLKWEMGKLSEIKLYPYVYGSVEADRVGDLWDGRCMLASGENANILLDHKKQLSAPYGTSIEIADGIGSVLIK